MKPAAANGARVGIAIATRNRSDQLLVTLDRLTRLPMRPPIAVADNGSDDGTAAAVRASFPVGGEHVVQLLALGHNRGAAARTIAARALRTLYVAFSDDDSWWDDDAPGRAAALLDAHLQVGLLAARVVVGVARRVDPTCDAMAASPLTDSAGAPAVPGVSVLGFVACGAVVRSDAFLAVSGFAERYGVGGEEQLLALDIRAAGWQVRYVAEVVAQHWPSPNVDRANRRDRILRNDLWSCWLRRPAGRVPDATLRTLRRAGLRAGTVRGAAAALHGLPWVVRERRPLPAAVEREVLVLERQRGV